MITFSFLDCTLQTVSAQGFVRLVTIQFHIKSAEVVDFSLSLAEDASYCSLS